MGAKADRIRFGDRVSHLMEASVFSYVHLFIYLFWPCHLAFDILVARPGIEPMPPAWEAQSPNHWTGREVPVFSSVFYFWLCFRHSQQLKMRGGQGRVGALSCTPNLRIPSIMPLPKALKAEEEHFERLTLLNQCPGTAILSSPGFTTRSKGRPNPSTTLKKMHLNPGTSQTVSISSICETGVFPFSPQYSGYSSLCDLCQVF